MNYHIKWDKWGNSQLIISAPEWDSFIFPSHYQSWGACLLSSCLLPVRSPNAAGMEYWSEEEWQCCQAVWLGNRKWFWQ